MSLPPPEDELLLLLAGTARRRAEAGSRARALLQVCDPVRLRERLDALRLTGVVGPRVLELGDPEGLADHVAAWFEGHRAIGQVQATTVRAVCARLEAAGVPALALKGPELALRLYGDVAARPSADVDVLVPAGALDRAVAALAGLGYAPTADDPWLLELHRSLAHTTGGLAPAELHHRVEWYDGAPFAAGVLRRSTPPDSTPRRAAPADELALLLLVHARDGFAGLRLPADLAAWWDRHGEELPPGALQPVADAHPGIARALATSAVVAERLVGLPAAQLLDRAPARAREARLAARLADPFAVAGWAEPALVDGLLATGVARRRWLRRRVAPPRGHVALTFALRPDDPRTRVHHALHPARAGLGLTRAALRAPRRTPGPPAAPARP